MGQKVLIDDKEHLLVVETGKAREHVCDREGGEVWQCRAWRADEFGASRILSGCMEV